MAPNQDLKFKLFALQLTKLKRGNSMLLNMLLGGITTKVCNEAFLEIEANSLNIHCRQYSSLYLYYLKKIRSYKLVDK